MKSTPILFKPEMIRACIDGRKRMTRRLVKPQPAPDATSMSERFPYGRVGDEIWAKETWRPSEWDEATGIVRVGYAAGGVKFFGRDDVPSSWEIPKAAILGRNVSLLFMPRWASRFVRTLTRVRVVKLQTITEADAIAEGIEPQRTDPRIEFRRLWDSINRDRAPWASNPWVWVLEW